VEFSLKLVSLKGNGKGMLSFFAFIKGSLTERRDGRNRKFLFLNQNSRGFVAR
jgi:hypothetical protein